MKFSELIAKMNDKVSVCTHISDIEFKNGNTFVTVGIPGNQAFEISEGRKIAWLVLMDKELVDEAKNSK